MMRCVFLVVLIARRVATLNVESRCSVVSLKMPLREGYGVEHALWCWKTNVLGNDMGLPRPRAARGLAEAMVSQEGVEEALVLSTCARLDIVLATRAQTLEDAETLCRGAVGAALAAQMEAWKKKPLSEWRYYFDMASEAISASVKAEKGIDGKKGSIGGVLEVHSGTRAAARHLASVAAGLTTNCFDPLSSKQAFVQRQVRAALEACDGGPTKQSLRVVARTALEASKKARSQTPENRRFQKYRDETSRKSAEKAAIELTLEAANLAVDRLSARDASDDVTIFRRRAHQVAQEAVMDIIMAEKHNLNDLVLSSCLSAASKAANRHIHDATLALRGRRQLPDDSILEALKVAAATAATDELLLHRRTLRRGPPPGTAAAGDY